MAAIHNSAHNVSEQISHRSALLGESIQASRACLESIVSHLVLLREVVHDTTVVDEQLAAYQAIVVEIERADTIFTDHAALIRQSPAQG